MMRKVFLIDIDGEGWQMKRFTTKLLFTLIIVMGLTGCFSSKNENEIIMGSSPGPYNELFDAAIVPILESKGYTVKSINFSALMEANIAMTEESVDVVVSQHAGYMKVFNAQRGTDLVAVTMIPTVPAGIFSNKYKGLEEIKAGMTILIPQDASNAARAYGLLEKAGWISLKKDINPMEAGKNDIERNPYQLKIQEIDSNLIPRVLDDTDYAVIPGSIVWLGQLDPAKVLLQETLLPDLYLQVVLLGKNQNTEWAQAIVDAYNSPEFKAYMDAHNENNYWILPPALDAI